MSKIFIMCVFILASLGSFAQADDRDDRGPGRREDREERRPGDRGIGYKTIANYRVPKLFETTNTIRLNSPHVRSVRLTARNNSVEIVEARLLLSNGREVYMDGLTGEIRRDRSETFTVRGNGPFGERVSAITIRSVSRNLIGSRANVEVAISSIR